VQAYRRFIELAPPEHEPHKLRAQMRIDQLTKDSLNTETPPAQP